MKQFLGKLIILFMALFLSLSIASCDFFKTTQTQAETTGEQSTLEITNSTVTTITDNTTVTTITDSTTTEITTTENTTVVTETTTDYENGAKLVVTSPNKTVYEVFDELNLNGLVVTYYDAENNSTVLNTGEYTVSEVDMFSYGIKQVTVTYGEYTSFFVIEVNLPSYYLNATEKSGDSLLLSLRTIVNTGFHGVTYGDARYMLDDTDRDPNNSSRLILVYLGTSVSGTWDSGNTWNREHVWPQSALPDSASNNTVNTCSDLHNLKPSDPVVNSSRGNKWFDNYSSSDSFEPRDEVKGDIARIMLYMVVKYKRLSLVDSNPNPDDYEMGIFTVLLQWHEQDPVDDFERNRNEMIYSYQGNRNPFIDYPEFADLIWN